MSTDSASILLKYFQNFKISFTISQKKLQIVLFIYVQTSLYLKHYDLLSRYHAVQFAIFLFTWLQISGLIFIKILRLLMGLRPLTPV